MRDWPEEKDAFTEEAREPRLRVTVTCHQAHRVPQHKWRSSLSTHGWFFWCKAQDYRRPYAIGCHKEASVSSGVQKL